MIYIKEEWISVDEKLPEEWEEVLAWDGENVRQGYYTMDIDWDDDAKQAETPRWTYYDGMLWENVTHWMPLPQPPKEKNNNECT